MCYLDVGAGLQLQPQHVLAHTSAHAQPRQGRASSHDLRLGRQEAAAKQGGAAAAPPQWLATNAWAKGGIPAMCVYVMSIVVGRTYGIRSLGMKAMVLL